jgi:hypothetical protein
MNNLKIQGVPFEVSINAPAGLLNVSINNSLLYALISCINAGF